MARGPLGGASGVPRGAAVQECPLVELYITTLNTTTSAADVAGGTSASNEAAATAVRQRAGPAATAPPSSPHPCRGCGACRAFDPLAFDSKTRRGHQKKGRR